MWNFLLISASYGGLLSRVVPVVQESVSSVRNMTSDVVNSGMVSVTPGSRILHKNDSLHDCEGIMNRLFSALRIQTDLEIFCNALRHLSINDGYGSLLSFLKSIPESSMLNFFYTIGRIQESNFMGGYIINVGHGTNPKLLYEIVESLKPRIDLGLRNYDFAFFHQPFKSSLTQLLAVNICKDWVINNSGRDKFINNIGRDEFKNDLTVLELLSIIMEPNAIQVETSVAQAAIDIVDVISNHKLDGAVKFEVATKGIIFAVAIVGEMVDQGNLGIDFAIMRVSRMFPSNHKDVGIDRRVFRSSKEDFKSARQILEKIIDLNHIWQQYISILGLGMGYGFRDFVKGTFDPIRRCYL